MEQYLLSEISEKELYISKCINRVTQRMINCDIVIMSRENLSEGGEKIDIQGAFNKYEKEAAFFYQTKGYEVIKLEHFASSGAGDKEHIFDESKELGIKLRKIFPIDEYQKFIYKSDACRKALVLNSIYPAEYSLSFYPPDFLVVKNDTKEWKFVEVKSPRDKLHFRQANWYVKLMPENWNYEIFASLNRKCDGVTIKTDLPRNGAVFEEIYSEEVTSTDKFNKRVPKT
ncbi:MAG: VRR-NUC domain-containing protein [Porticoccaceae bacterium]|nr:VRR-NUC domain-containing protein [Porticoccaceae bacterium]